MIRKILFFLFIAALGIAFWYSPTMKEITAGVAIVLFGMISLEEGFRNFTEGPLKTVIRRSTRTFAQSLGVGVLFTAVLQSSSLISIIVISFVSTGLIALRQGIGIIFGSNIGTTATGWLVAVMGLKLDIAAVAFPMLVFGIIFILQKGKVLNGLGGILAGLGFFFLGIQLMKDGFEGLQFDLNLDSSATGYLRESIYVGIGIGLTVLLQSSSATLALTLTALAAGSISFVDSLSLAIGANMGTTVTAVLGAAAANTAGRRLAGAHLFFNLGTGLLAFLFLSQLQWVVEWGSRWLNIGSEEYTLKLALFHTLFNCLGVIVFVPAAGKLEKALNRIVPEDKTISVEQPKYLNKAALNHPQAATEALIQETRNLIGHAYEIIAHGLNLHYKDIVSTRDLHEVVQESTQVIPVDIDDTYRLRIKNIYGKIIKFATIAATLERGTEEEISVFHRIKLANRHLVEAVKTTNDIKTNVSKYMMSNNQYIKLEYNQFRYRLATIMRELQLSQDSDDTEAHLKKLRKLRKKLKKRDVVHNGTLDLLIRKELIDTKRASSLMNDSAFVSAIGKDLIKVAELLHLETHDMPEAEFEAEADLGIDSQPIPPINVENQVSV